MLEDHDDGIGLTAAQATAFAHVRHEPTMRQEPGRALDDYIEAQVHGPVILGRDVEALVADPSFLDTGVGIQLEALAQHYGFPLAFHQGFCLASADVVPGFRGPAVAALAQRISAELADSGRLLDAELLGRAARWVVTSQGGGSGERGDTAEALQHIKQLWHVLVAYGLAAG